MLNKIQNFVKRKDGVAAVEFAILAPLMLTMYVGTVEAGNFLSVNMKVTNTAATLADLVARAPHIDDSSMDLMFEAVDIIMRPADVSEMEVVVTSLVAVTVSGELKYQVRWSNSANGNATARTIDSFVEIPTTSVPPVLIGGIIVMSELSYTYQPVIEGAPGFGAILHGGIEMVDIFFDSPRNDKFWRCATFNNDGQCDTNEF